MNTQNCLLKRRKIGVKMRQVTVKQKPYKDPVDTYSDSYNNCQII